MTEESTVKPIREQDKFPCPNCSKKLVYNPRRAGRILSCPHCWNKFEMPVTELALLTQIRDSSAATQFWVRLIFWTLPVLFTWVIWAVIGLRFANRL
ncbi:MAG: putative RNA-binding Zn-ribbon protein involved in translation (DUF1610 family) [Planctomycetaceae bacterium]|jgi:predicted RNA-binding Zn-ribbon protein involved in translation (DUF1610 family)